MKTTVATPRLSIVLPFESDIVAFEETLLSVLENRPPACEVLVVHDGSYSDPFELSDEVRFVTADSDQLVDCVAAGCDASWGRYVHVLSGGAKATEGWTIDALRRFEEESVAAVAPVLREHRDAPILAAGWRDTTSGLMQPVDAGSRSASGEDRRLGVYLNASFWRREVLRSLTRACVSVDPLIATYAYRQLQQDAGWKSRVAIRSEIHTSKLGSWNQAGWSRGRALRGLKRHFEGTNLLGSLVASLGSALRGNDLAEALGESAGAFSTGAGRLFEQNAVYTAQVFEESRRVA